MQKNRLDTLAYAARVHAVIVTYKPDDRVTELLHALSPQVENILVIDNGSSQQHLRVLRSSCAEVGAILIALGENTGIAHAQNVGIEHALKQDADYVLLFDQDSIPQPDMVLRLVSFFSEMNNKSSANRLNPVAAVGPCVTDSKGNGNPLVAVNRRWFPGKVKRTDLDSPAISAAYLLASGCLISRDALLKVGKMNEGFFIDHVDTEWCLRARKRGYQLFVDTDARLDHSLGDSTVTIPILKRKVNVHAPVRSYYVVRNTIALCRTSLMPVRWRLRHLFWLIPYSLVNIFFTDQPRERLYWVTRGVRDGITARTGKAEHPTSSCR